jgi:arsenite methyltransferase
MDKPSASKESGNDKPFASNATGADKPSASKATGGDKPYPFDAALSKRVEALYTTPDVAEQRQRVLSYLKLQPAERVVDIGSGPGFLAAEIGAQVGPTGRVSGLDTSENMITLARARCSAQPWIEFRAGNALSLPLSDGEFDAAVCTQVYEYVADMATALREAHRILRAGGRLLVLDTDWQSIVWHSKDPARMQRVLRDWDHHLADPHLPQTLEPKLRQAGFRVHSRAVIPLLNVDYAPATYSHGMIDIIRAFVAARGVISKDEASAWAEELRELGRRGEYFFSLNRYLFLAAKA